MAENPGTDKVEDLLKQVNDGSFVIPYFQRGFEWKPSMVSDLIESILQDYYVGLILLWELNPEEAKKEKWDPIWGANLRNNPTKAILDGQQRLASLYYAIYNPEKKFPNRKSFCLFFINIGQVLNEEYEESITYKFYRNYQTWNNIEGSKNEWLETSLVPLCILSAKDPANPSKRYIDSTAFDNWLQEYVNRIRGSFGQEITTHKIYQIFNRIYTYPFVFFPLNSTRKLPDICNIFARVNEKGMKLSTFDLLNAFLYPKGVQLRKDLWENLDNERLKKIDDNMNEYLLKFISLVKQNYCSSKYLFNLIPGQTTTRKDDQGKKYEEILVQNADEFKSLWKAACKYAEKARARLMNTGSNDFGAIKAEFIPNTTIIPVLGALLYEYESRGLTLDITRELKKWYWFAVFSEDYTGSSDSVMGKDFRDWKNFLESNTVPDRINRVTAGFVNDIDLTKVTKGSARYNAILCLLALNNAQDFYERRILGTGDYANEKINDHHIFPANVKGLSPDKSKFFKEVKDSILNRTLLLDETNNKIKHKKPSEYILIMSGKYPSEEKMKEALVRHIIDDEAFKCLKNDDFDGFIQAREKVIKDKIIEKLGLNS
jgi:hypothetical protein